MIASSGETHMKIYIKMVFEWKRLIVLLYGPGGAWQQYAEERHLHITLTKVPPSVLYRSGTCRVRQHAKACRTEQGYTNIGSP